jgi:hypothetical protein
MKINRNKSLPQRVWSAIKRWDPWYWIRAHTYNRYHIINISGQDGYKWGWIDRSHAMYLACFKILVEFVEQEDPTVGLRTEADYRGNPDSEYYIPDDEYNKYHKPAIDHQLETEREVRALYDWWKVTRDQEWTACYAMSRGKNMYAEMDRLEAKDEEMLMRLMKVRQCLWT